MGRNTILSCKNGDIVLDEDANVGFNVEVFSAATVRVGKKVLIAAYTYLVGGDHLYDRVDVPVLDQGRTARGIDVGDNVWLGAHVVVADGVRIGRDAVVGAGAVVTSDVPEFHVAAGVPARVIRDRRTSESGNSTIASGYLIKRRASQQCERACERATRSERAGEAARERRVGESGS